MIIANLNGPLSLFTETKRNLPIAGKDRGMHVLRPNGLNGKLNLGDMFVIRATADQLNPEKVYHLTIKSSDEAIERVNKECDLLVLKGGNFLKPNWISQKKIKIPITIIGYGMQGQVNNLYLNDEDIKSIKYIHDSCKSVMVRGNSTAEYLESIGVNNAKTIGCPTLFLKRKPELIISKPTLENTTWTYRKNLYTKKDDMYQYQFNSIEWLKKQSENSSILLQGEEESLQSYVAIKEWGASRSFEENKHGDLVITTFADHNLSEVDEEIYKQFGQWTSKELLDWIKDHSFFSYDIDEYLKYLATRSLIAGCRLHGNLMALSQGH
jgi:hypothetical protein